MADGRHFENRYIAISQRKIIGLHHEILYAAEDFELDERHVIKNEIVALNRLRVRHNVFLLIPNFVLQITWDSSGATTINVTGVGKQRKTVIFEVYVAISRKRWKTRLRLLLATKQNKQVSSSLHRATFLNHDRVPNCSLVFFATHLYGQIIPIPYHTVYCLGRRGLDLPRLTLRPIQRWPIAHALREWEGRVECSQM